MSSGMDSSIDGSEEMAYKDPPKTKAQQQASYIKHPEERPAANRNRKYYLEHVDQTRATLQCSKCVQSFPDCPMMIESHHAWNDPKLRGLTRLMGRCLRSKRLQTELAQCSHLSIWRSSLQLEDFQVL